MLWGTTGISLHLPAVVIERSQNAAGDIPLYPCAVSVVMTELKVSVAIFVVVLLLLQYFFLHWIR